MPKRKLTVKPDPIIPTPEAALDRLGVPKGFDARARGVDRVKLAVEVGKALATVDQTAALKAEADRIEWDIYDGTQEVLDYREDPPKAFTDADFRAFLRSRGDWDGSGAVFLGYLDGKLWIIQPHEPEVEGLNMMNVAEAEAKGQAMLEGFARDVAGMKVEQELRKALDG